MLPADVDDFELWEDELGRKVHEITDEEGNVELVGDALWPEREPTENLLQTRQSIDPLVWAALYQQNPALSSDLMFRPENWQEYKAVYRTELMGSCTKLVRVWDLAASDKKGDWTVGCLMGLHRSGLIYVFDVQRVRKNATAVEELVRATAEIDGRKVKIMIEQERAGAGKTVLAHYQKILMGWIVEEARAETDKASRAMLYSSKQGNGLVYLPDEAAWKAEWVKEHEGFPNIRHDDQVDTGAYAFNDLTLGFFDVAFWSPVESPRPLVYFGDPAAAGLALMNRS
jgi:predicted phage terminase large subunit-like protein